MEDEAGFWVGLVSCAVASIFFGSMFVPIKALPTGDGVFVQWTMGAGIWLVGLVVQIVRGFPPFHPLAMLGGFLWAAGNVVCVPVVRELGMALALLLWGFTNLVFGWASGRFGWFGLTPQVPASDLLNGLGLALSVISTIMFGFVGSNPVIESKSHAHLDTSPLIPAKPERSRKTKRILAMLGALYAGAAFGFSFAPVIYMEDNTPGASKNGLDYVFAFFCGIFLTATVFLLIYAAAMKNRPIANPQTILPGVIAGVIWGVAETAWFIANDKLSEAITMPIITRFPGVVGAIWGIFVFKEITGARNLTLLSVAGVVTVMGGILSGLSKIVNL